MGAAERWDCRHRTRGNGRKFSRGSFRLDIRERFLTQRVVGHGTGSPGKWGAPNLTGDKKCLDNALRVGLLVCPVLGQELDRMIRVVPFKLRLFCDSAIFSLCSAGLCVLPHLRPDCPSSRLLSAAFSAWHCEYC